LQLVSYHSIAFSGDTRKTDIIQYLGGTARLGGRCMTVQNRARQNLSLPLTAHGHPMIAVARRKIILHLR
jgi:hypothetical protein